MVSYGLREVKLMIYIATSVYDIDKIMFHTHWYEQDFDQNPVSLVTSFLLALRFMRTINFLISFATW